MPAKSQPHAGHWKARCTEVLCRRNWGDEEVVFSGNSGATHLLSVDAAAVLTFLIDAGDAVPINTIAQGIRDLEAGENPHEGSDQLEDAVLSILNALRRIGLAEPTTSQ